MSTLATAFQLVWWIVRNPQIVLTGWVVMWLALLYMSASSQGIIGAIQFAITGLFSMTSLFGLVLPGILLFIMLLPVIHRMMIKGATGLFKAVQAQMMKGAKDAAKALNNAKKALNKATKNMKNMKKMKKLKQEEYLGSGVYEGSLEESLDALGEALELYQGYDALLE